MTEKRLAAAKAMRKAPAFTERLLWKLLRNRNLESLKFRRQFPIGPYVADFICLRHRLIVEADGYWHDPERDAVRDAALKAQNFRVLRFENRQIQNAPDEVIAAILAAIAVPPLDEPKEPLGLWPDNPD